MSTGAPVPATPLPLTALLDEAVRHFRRHFRAIYIPVFLPVALVSGILPVVQILTFRGMALGSPPADPLAMVSGIALFSVTAIAIGLVSGLGQVAAMVGVIDALAERPVRASRCWLFPLSPAPAGTLLLTWLIAMAGFCFCILPGIYLTLLLAFVVPVMADEGITGTEALARSRDLAQHNPQRDITADPRLKVFVIMLVGVLLAYVVGIVVDLPVTLLQQLLLVRSVAAGHRPDPNQIMGSMLWLAVPTAILGAMARMAVGLYASFGVGLLFFDVRRRKEGLDLEAAIASLGGAPALEP